ncbi:MAG: hypothetical protein ACRDD8_05940 [Bacteroidales bacterium]
MPINFAQNGYSGEVLEDLLVYTVIGNDTYKEGLIHIKPGIKHKYTLPSIKLDKVIQDNKPTPQSPADSKGQYTIGERTLEPQDFMIYLEFNPRDYEKYWAHTHPDGNLVFRTLDPQVQAKMLHLLIDKKDEYIGNAIWNSVKGGSAKAGITAPEGSDELGLDSYKYYDGIIKRILDNLKENTPGETCVLAGSTKLDTGIQVEAAMNAMWKKCPKNIRKKALVFVMDWNSWDLYDQFLSDKEFKYGDNRNINDYKFKGKRIIPIQGITEHTIVLGQFTKGMESNLWAGVDYSDDTEKINIDKLQANSEMYFFQMRMKMDVNIVRPAEIVVHTAYTVTAA